MAAATATAFARRTMTLRPAHNERAGRYNMPLRCVDSAARLKAPQGLTTCVPTYNTLLTELMSRRRISHYLVISLELTQLSLHIKPCVCRRTFQQEGIRVPAGRVCQVAPGKRGPLRFQMTLECHGATVSEDYALLLLMMMCFCVFPGILYFRALLSTIMLVSLSCPM